MKENKSDVERFAAIVREYHRQKKEIPMDRYGTRDRTMMEKQTRSYRDACDTLQDEIGEDRMMEAREAYDEGIMSQCEAAEDRWIESHYR